MKTKPGVILTVRGRAGTAGRVNANRRLYPAAVYEKVVREFADRGSDNPILGELDHPDRPPGCRLEKTALRITDLWMAEGRFLEFEAQVLDTPHGRTLKSLLEAGIPVQVSTRGTGSLRTSESSDGPAHLVVAEDYELQGIDAVVRAAHPGSRMEPHVESQQAAPADSDCRAAELPGGEGPADSSLLERSDEMIVLTEELPAAEAGPSLEDELRTAREDLSVLQTAAAAERAAFTENTQGLQADMRERDGQIESLRARCEEAESALNRRLVAEEVDQVTGPLRPDVRGAVRSQLEACQTPKDVQERWESIHGVLAAADLIHSEPAGLGRTASEPHARTYTPEQEMQRRLLAG